MATKTSSKGSTDQIRMCWFVGGLLAVIGVLLVLRGVDGGDSSLLVGGLLSTAAGAVALLIAVVATAVRIGSNAARDR